MNLKVLSAGLALAAALLGVLVANLGRNPHVVASPLVGRAAPPFSLMPVGGGAPLSLPTGRPVVLNFWASWCEPCRDESPLLQRWHERLEQRDATVLGVDAFDEIGSARAFVDRYGLTYPMLRDGPGDTRERFGILGFPETFVIDRRGRIAAFARGPVGEDFMRRRVVPLLREPA